MARPKNLIPTYRHHKGTDQAVCTITSPNGARRDVYLGHFGTDDSIVEFGRLLIQWKGGSPPADTGSISINELMVKYLEHATGYYGDASKELAHFKHAMKRLRELFGATPVGEFTPKKLKAVRERMVSVGWSRKTVNHQVERLRRMFAWAVEEELVGPNVLVALREVKGLKRGRCQARETDPVLPVADATIEATLPFLTPTVAAMVRLQRCTGCRPNEVIRMRPIDLDVSRDDVWLYKPILHKLTYRGKSRVIPLGPRAQEILRPFLTTDLPVDQPVFSPAQARAERFSIMRSKRRSKVQPSQICRAKDQPTKSPGLIWTAETYAQAIRRAVEAAARCGIFIEPWSPGRLRHARGTEVRDAEGIEAAAAMLGHSQLSTTEIYTAKAQALAIKIARATG